MYPSNELGLQRTLAFWVCVRAEGEQDSNLRGAENLIE
jgi:hypothetical protein